MSAHDEMNRRILDAAGRSRVRVVSELPEPNRAMNSLLLAASGRVPAEPHPSEALSEDADTFAREATLQGIPPDLVDVARPVIPNADELSGAALRSTVAKTIEERPSLRTAESRIPQAPAGLDGGVRSNIDLRTEAERMNSLIRRKAGRGGVEYGLNGLPLGDE